MTQTAEQVDSDAPTAVAPPAVRLVGGATETVWGLTGAERLERAFRQAGAEDIAAWPTAARAAKAVLIRADYVIEPDLARALLAADDSLVCDAEGVAFAAAGPASEAASMSALIEGRPTALDLRRVAPDDLVGSYVGALRKRRRAVVVGRITPQRAGAIERALFDASYKGVTDIVTRFVWPWPAFHATRLCVRLGLSPNQVTWASLALVLAALALFLAGWFAAGLAAAWVMTFLDTVDGKLARVTLTSSRLGNVLDHGIDLLHPPFWYWAWLVGLERAGYALPWPDLVAATVLGGYVLGRLQEGIALAAFKMELHVWRRFDSRFRLITARRNPNLVLLSAAMLFARPDLGMLAVALWTAASLLVHTVRLVQAAGERMRLGRLESWLAT